MRVHALMAGALHEARRHPLVLCRLAPLLLSLAFASVSQAQTVVTVHISGGLVGTGSLTYQYPFDPVPVSFDLDGTNAFTEADTHTWNASVWNANGELTAFAVHLFDDAGGGPTFFDVDVQTDGTWTGGFLSGTYTLATTPEPVVPSGCVASSDTETYATIDALRAAAAAIVIDGNDADWAAFPSFDDPADDGPGGSDQEIVASSFAPMTDRVKVLARTAGAPSQAQGAFAVKLDLVGNLARDVLVVLNPPSGPHYVITFDELNQPENPTTPGLIGSEVQVSFGADFLEVEIPYSALAPWVPELAPSVQPLRPWSRGGIDALAGGSNDLGPSVGSYLLRPTPFSLEPASTATLTTPLRVPAAAAWLVVQGAFGPVSHQGGHAYDFARVDASFLLSDPPGSTDLADYPAFGQPLLAPATGTVTQAVDTNPDVTPGAFDPFAVHNVFAMDVGAGLEATMLHAREGQGIVSVSDAVAPGQPLAQVGNSGYTLFPHVHLEVNEFGDPIGLSAYAVDLTDVFVSLNPVADDPWVRRCASWVVRAGYLVSNFDSDGDGLCDGALPVSGVCVAGEDLDADGVVDPDETDPANPDTDGDGLDDGVDPDPLPEPGAGISLFAGAALLAGLSRRRERARAWRAP